ncbi:MAG: matrixin family metalloprotease [Rhodomicrobium sp.]
MMRVSLPMALAAMSLVFDAGAGRAAALLQVQGHTMRWAPEAAAPVTSITYAILKGPYSVQSDRSILSPSNCSKMHAFAGILAATPELSEEAAKRELHSAFQAWEAAANVEFVEVADPGRANIVIGAADDPGGRAFANLSYRTGKGVTPIAMALGRPRSASSGADAAGDASPVAIDQAYVCLNGNSRWKAGFDGNLDVYDLRHTFTHEVGHAIGLDHPDSTGAVMAFRYDERVRELQASDVAAVQRLYGARNSQK